MKVGVGIADVMCGMYAGQAVLAALHHRNQTGEGQHIDVSLYDTQLAWLVNEGMNYLVSDEVPQRRGTAHPNIVPYQVFATSDGYFMLAVGNDVQFEQFCLCAGAPHLAQNEKFSTNPARIIHRKELVALIEDITRLQTTQFWLSELTRNNVPCGPVQTIEESLGHEHTKARAMVIAMSHEMISEEVRMIANPLKFEKTPVSYRTFPPRRGEHTRDILGKELGLDDQAIDQLNTNNIIEVGQANKEHK